MRKIKHNLLIGYYAFDEGNNVIGPKGTKQDLLFATEERAMAAGKKYGKANAAVYTGGLYLGGLLGIVLDDVGDIEMDGISAQRLVEACQWNGIEVVESERKRIRKEEEQAVYSSRRLLGG